jgi:Protein of unknown function (DUF 659)
MRDRGVENSITRRAAQIAGGQQKIAFPKLLDHDKAQLDSDFANVCYVQSLPFNIYESDAMKVALNKLNPAYKPPTRQAISTHLLDSAYESLKVKVDAVIQGLHFLNVISDESTNINNNRIFNISLHTDAGAIHWHSEDIGDRQMTASNIANILKTRLLELSNGDLKRINTVATDTCPTMLAAWELMRSDPELSHIFFIPCDSHGLQLLVKDIVSLPSFKIILDKAQSVAKAFKNSPLQLARLRVIQKAVYNEHRSLCLSVITRWGTQYRLVHSVSNNKDALRRYALNHDIKELPYNAGEYIESTPFWQELEQLREILKPLDEAIRMSESGLAGLGTVIPRWEAILKHLSTHTNDFSELRTFLEPNEGFSKRYNRQVIPLHVVAFYLTPKNRQLNFDSNYQTQIFDFFARYANSEAEAMILREDYCYYISQIGPFDTTNPCWKHEDNATSFWLLASIRSQLGKLALRVFKAPCNSVPSERAFSIQNLIHTKTRNQLRSEKVDKLTYIYINTRVLNASQKVFPSTHLNSTKRSPTDLTEAELVELEDELIQDEGMSDVERIDDDLDEH